MSTVTSERIGTLWTLHERCAAGNVEAMIDACVAASAIVGDPFANIEEDWRLALAFLRGEQSRRRSLRGSDVSLDPTDQVLAWEQADEAFYAEVDHAIDSWESQFEEAVA